MRKFSIKDEELLPYGKYFGAYRGEGFNVSST
jgi:hypothetical protein